MSYRPTRTDPVGSLPPNAALPATAHELADEWRAADDRLSKLDAEQTAARAAIATAKLRDADLFKAAILAGKQAPAESAHENAAKAALTALERQGPVFLTERNRVGTALARLLRSDVNRHHVADSARDAIEPAVAAYKAALDEAESAVRRAHAELTSATVLLSFIDKVDSSNGIHPSPYPIAGLPDFATARRHLAAVDARVAALAERGQPHMRRVRRIDGRELTVLATLAADWLRDGEVDQFVDGFPAERPSPRPGGSHHGSRR